MLNPTYLLEHFIDFVFMSVFRKFFNVVVFLSVFRGLFYCVLITVRLPSIPHIILLLTSFLVHSLIIGYLPAGGSPSFLMKVVLAMENVAIESKMAMEAVIATAEVKTYVAGSHFLPPDPVAVAHSEAEERDVDNTSTEIVMMAPHSNVCDERPNTIDSLDGVIPTDATKKAYTENPGSRQGSQVGWTIYSGCIETLPVPMIPPDLS